MDYTEHLQFVAMLVPTFVVLGAAALTPPDSDRPRRRADILRRRGK